MLKFKTTDLILSFIKPRGDVKRNVIVLGGAHHKVEDPPTQAVKLSFFVGGNIVWLRIP